MFTQAEFDIRLEWGEQGVNLLASISDVVIIVDVLSFSTSVEIATSRKADGILEGQPEGLHRFVPGGVGAFQDPKQG